MHCFRSHRLRVLFALFTYPAIWFMIEAVLKTMEDIMAKYVCTVCGYEYDPAVGDPDGSIAPGTAFEDIPDDWVCPVCGVGKDSFSKVE